MHDRRDRRGVLANAYVDRANRSSERSTQFGLSLGHLGELQRRLDGQLCISARALPAQTLLLWLIETLLQLNQPQNPLAE